MQGQLRGLVGIAIYFVLLALISVKLTIYFVDRTAIVSFKKLYSAYSQALLITVDEMEGNTGCYFSSDRKYPSDYSHCDKFYKNFATNLRVTKYCKNNAFAKGCVPVYKNYIGNPQCAGFSENMINRYNQTFVMNDKTILTVFNMPANVQNPLFAVDTNGMLFPNRAGYDLFSFVIMRNAKGDYYFHPNVTYCLPMEKGGVHNLQDAFK